MLKPLDIVRTPAGSLAMIVECSPANDNLPINKYSIRFIEHVNYEYNSWWEEKHLTYLASISILISEAMCHPFGDNKKYIKDIFNNKT